MALSMSLRALLALKCGFKRELIIARLALYALVINFNNIIDINSGKQCRFWFWWKTGHAFLPPYF
jgi:hypothetical protein